ncbi:hypothetical protein [Ostreiculturibacter nitratireducens]|uniref:hypothetical protein n=1 Tax=Ostreiculturibacter nitratireducens TaxID=3075226 RepID=UPI0031B5DAFF
MADMTMGRTGTQGASVSLPLIAVAAALLAFLGMEVTAFVSTGGHFEYPLDDVYIHLSIAEQITLGGYGINTGEYASAASSPLYPFLLTPFAGTEAQRFLPLLWNTLALILAAFLWGRTLVLSGYDRMTRIWPGILLAALGPLAVNAYGLAYAGMAHTLHLAAALAIICGLTRFVVEGRIGAALVLGVLLSPAFRLEGLALALSAAGMVALLGRWRAGLLLGFAALLPVATFAGFLVALGLEPLPNSVAAKLAVAAGEDYGLSTRIVATLMLNLEKLQGWVVLGLSILSIAAAPILGREGRADLRLYCYVIGFSGLAHMGLGHVGWLNRYEIYIFAALVLGLAAILGLAGQGSGVSSRGRAAIALPLAVMTALAGGFYAHDAATRVVWAPQLLWQLHAQMARFTREYVEAPVAVNDIGHVSWRNPNYVLDLWGLASDEARHLRLEGEDPRWAGTLAARAEVGLAMVLDSWIGQHTGEDWVRLGELAVATEPSRLGDWSISFYATSPDEVPALLEALERFRPTLPEGVEFRYEGEVKLDEAGLGSTRRLAWLGALEKETGAGR